MKTAQTIKITLPTIDLVAFELYVEQDRLTPVRGNALSSGNDAVDKLEENRIIKRLSSGDEWAWASVEVRACWNGLTASDYLGACSYRDENDFKKGGYWDDMKETAYRALLDRIRGLGEEMVTDEA